MYLDYVFDLATIIEGAAIQLGDYIDVDVDTVPGDFRFRNREVMVERSIGFEG